MLFNNGSWAVSGWLTCGLYRQQKSLQTWTDWDAIDQTRALHLSVQSVAHTLQGALHGCALAKDPRHARHPADVLADSKCFHIHENTETLECPVERRTSAATCQPAQDEHSKRVQVGDATGPDIVRGGAML